MDVKTWWDVQSAGIRAWWHRTWCWWWHRKGWVLYQRSRAGVMRRWRCTPCKEEWLGGDDEDRASWWVLPYREERSGRFFRDQPILEEG